MTEKQKILFKLIERLGLERVSKSTGLSIYEIYNQLDGYLDFTPEICNEILENMFNETSLLKRKEGEFTLDWGVFTDGVCTWFYNNEKTGEKLTTLATPFWDGNDFTPINIEGYVVDRYDPKTKEWSIVYQEYPEMWDALRYDEIPESFERLSHLINWFNDVYFEDVKEVILDGLSDLRINAKLKGI